MRQKQLAIIIFALALLNGYIVWSSDTEIREGQKSTCEYCQGEYGSESCPMGENIPKSTFLGTIIFFVILSLSAFLYFGKDETEQKASINKAAYKKLKPDEKTIIDIILKDGPLFQSELVEKSKLNKVKVSRILDILEARKLIEKKRRGMSNIVFAK